MFKILKTYYLYQWIVFSILFLISALFRESVNPLSKDILVSQIIAIILTLFVGTIYYFLDTKWGPNERTKRLKKTPFKELLEIGFEVKENQLIGTFNDYQVLAQYQWSGTNGKPSIIIYTLFNPKIDHRFIPEIKIKDLNKKYKKQRYNWTINSVSYEWSFNFRPPKFEKIEEFLVDSVKYVKEEKLEPMTLSDTDKIHSEYLAFLEKNK